MGVERYLCLESGHALIAVNLGEFVQQRQDVQVRLAQHLAQAQVELHLAQVGHGGPPVTHLGWVSHRDWEWLTSYQHDALAMKFGNTFLKKTETQRFFLLFFFFCLNLSL